MSNRYDKMDDYVKSVFNVFQIVNRNAEQKNDKRFKMIGLTIYNYARYMATENEIDLKNITEPDKINLIPIFEYVAFNNIEFLDFSNINMKDIDITKKEDLERFVLSHIYYITQGNK
jgi:UV DNA damage repair endonuclease